MNLRGIANSVAQIVNPNVLATFRKSTGYTKGAGQKQIPSYQDYEDVPVQKQALSGDDLKQIEKLNIQGTVSVIYSYQQATGTQRPTEQGGDLFLLGSDSWLVVKVLEQWPQWTKCVVVLQSPTP